MQGRWGGWLIVPGLLFLGFAGLCADDKVADSPVIVNVVDYRGLGQVIGGLKGKVIVVDFWSTTCGPCRKAFPELVRLHQQYTGAGLATVSVSLDEEPRSLEVKKRVLAFLRAKNAAFTNILLDESPEVWQKQFDQDGMPFVYVFNREGKWVKKFSGEFEYAEVERLALDLLTK